MAYRSISTVKADQARQTFGADGDGIVWAVISSGIDCTHPHFRTHSNLELTPPLMHRDFTVTGEEGNALSDAVGVGTSVASIIAGELSNAHVPLIAQSRSGHSDAARSFVSTSLKHISGMAPKCKLISLKVLDDSGKGPVSAIIQALAAVEELNDNGREIRVHGVDIGLGYEWDAELYACGQSPLCVAVDRLVRSGVVPIALGAPRISITPY
jgi:subtilisin family serine protease